MKPHGRDVTLLTIAGVYTAPNFLDEFRETMAARLARGNRSVDSVALFPYGDWSRSKAAQSAEIAADLGFAGIGGRRVAGALAEDRGPGTVVLTGHSGGGVAAVHAAPRLIALGWNVAAIIMIGSPRTPIPPRLRERTVSIAAVDGEGVVKDRIARLGAWFGRAPGRIVGLPIIGGHADYFRASPPFVNEAGESNLDATTKAAIAWLEGCFSQESNA